MEFVVEEVPDVDATVVHYHFTVKSLVVLPFTLKARTVSPNHFSFSLSFSTSKHTLVLPKLTFVSSLGGFYALLVNHFSVAVRITILEYAFELVSVAKLNTTEVLQTAIDDAPSVSATFFFALFYLE